MSLLLIFGLFIIAYLLGSLPTGLLLTKAAGMGDIRNVGSGNIGATNVLRTGKKHLAALTLLFDMLKGALAVWIAKSYLPSDPGIINAVPSSLIYLVAVMALLGHIFPVWLKFKGGKGVATAFGILYALAPYVFFITASNWLAMFWVKRISSLSALIAFMMVPFWLYIFTDMKGLLFGLAMACILAYTHRENIKRLIAGTEPRFGKSLASSSSPIISVKE